jgi:hypothetical protein
MPPVLHPPGVLNPYAPWERWPDRHPGSRVLAVCLSICRWRKGKHPTFSRKRTGHARGRTSAFKKRPHLALQGTVSTPAIAEADAGPLEAGARASWESEAEDVSRVHAELEVAQALLAQADEELARLPFRPGESVGGVTATVGGFFEVENSIHFEYEVRDIVDHQMGSSGPRPRLVLVSWMGYPSSFDSWEPAGFLLPNAEGILSDYTQRRRRAPRRS